ncbi:DUF1878 family protein [Aquibacillus kalidii]|uniref:DUF1878 family protein n=1 Tax=Aquibacillus kalidii TaxID=2762597 RepID=UPI0016491D1B|nr:DUF1878 family protein [Aquibacillus kalidii]
MGSSGDLENLRLKIDLLLQISDMEQYPFTKMLLENEFSKLEYEQLIAFLNHLNDSYKSQKEEGFLDYEWLLLHFVGMLNEKLEPIKTLHALKKEGCYPSLVEVLLKIHERNT